MRDVLWHRGPDGEGLFVDGNVGLGHRRLSIIDVAGGRQPMANEDNTLHIVFNGEIYNHLDYRLQLQERGHVYRTRCDTETILHLYEEHGPGVVDKLRGMFAFAIWDQRRKELFIARDRLGIKPLYFVHTDEGSLYFASEIKSLLRARAVPPQVNFSALPDYLANHATSGEETLFVGVKRLLPGHTLRWQDGQIRVEKYWDIQFTSGDNESDAHRSDESYIEEWRECFRTSVRLHLMADVPLGIFLSGGIDSSAIVATASEIAREPVKTFSVAFAEREANELEYARLVARAYKTDHHEILVSPEEFFDKLPNLVWHEDEPLAHPSSVALNCVSQLAAEHVKVVLSGEGSDEMLAGYDRYRKTIYNVALSERYHKLSSAGIRRVISNVGDFLPLTAKARQKLKRTFLFVPPDIESIYFDNFAVFPHHMQNDLLSSDTKERAGAFDPYRDMRLHLQMTDAKTLLNRLLYVDSKTYLHELLMKQDQMSMAASIESRVPFLDHELVRLTARLPERMKLRGWTTKHILRESMTGLLPERILTRPKLGFPVPVGSWFRGRFRSIIDGFVLSERSLGRGIFNPAFVRALVARHQSGAEDHAERLWALVNFEIWQRQFIDLEGREIRKH